MWFGLGSLHWVEQKFVAVPYLEKKSRSIILMHKTALSVSGLFSTRVSSRVTISKHTYGTALTSFKEFEQESLFVSATLKGAQC
jgi:hypothetical protein